MSIQEKLNNFSFLIYTSFFIFALYKFIKHGSKYYLENLSDNGSNKDKKSKIPESNIVKFANALNKNLIQKPKNGKKQLKNGKKSEKNAKILENIQKITNIPLVEANTKSPTLSAYDAVIVGAGVVGSALAIMLAKQGRSVLVIERALGLNVDKKKIIGELLQPSGKKVIQKLGLDGIWEKTDLSEVDGYKIVHGDKKISCNYPKSIDGEIEIGFGFHNYRFVNSLRTEFAKYSGIDLIEGTVNKVNKSQNEEMNKVIFKAKDESGETINKTASSNVVFVCDGCFSSFRSGEEKEDIKVYGYFLGICLKNCVLKDKKKAMLILTKPSNILLYPIGNDELRLLIDFKQKISSKELTKEFFENIKNSLPIEAHKPFDEAIKTKEYRVMPNQSMFSHQSSGTVLQVGDSYNMRHPITGAGMTVGLSDVACLTQKLEKIKDFKSTKEIIQAFSNFQKERQKVNSTLNILACALYEVLSADNPDLISAFFEYVGQGGYKQNGPMRLLSGISRNENELFLHFCAVIILAARKQIKGIPNWKQFLETYRLIRVGVQILAPLVENEGASWYIKLGLMASKVVFWLDL